MNVFNMFKNWKKSKNAETLSQQIDVDTNSENECGLCCVVLDTETDSLEAVENGLCQECYEFEDEIDEDFDDYDEEDGLSDGCDCEICCPELYVDDYIDEFDEKDEDGEDECDKSCPICFPVLECEEDDYCDEYCPVHGRDIR